ncbi:MAG: hypothetical protein KJ052_18585, partial [Candidatus Hydrogenedentes bacterium]|nr:hypothetical protein [Candidatus Hydrogenedentota bacterium]
MRYIPYVLTLKSPAIISELSGDPNSASTMSYIPGASIRGAVAAALGEKDPLFRDLILGGAVAYLNAYPLRGVSRTLPTPVSWRHDRTISRTEERGAFDFAAESHLDMSLEDEVQGPHEKLVRFSEPFV